MKGRTTKVRGSHGFSLILLLTLSALATACYSAPMPGESATAPTVALPIASPTPLPTETRIASPTLTPAPTPAPTLPAGATPNPNGQVSTVPSPDKRWTAVLDTRVGSLELERDDGQRFTVFAAGSSAHTLTWSPDSKRLLAVQTHWLPPQASGAITSSEPIQLWQIQVAPDRPMPPVVVFQSQVDPKKPDTLGPQQIVFGHWSPNSRYVLFWTGMLSGSILADGLPLRVLDLQTGRATLVAETALLNPLYQSWAADSSALVFTAGGYRSAQVKKWLNLYDVGTGKVRTVVDEKEAVPGIVAWSPRGDLVAYAAVRAADTGMEWADYMGFSNLAIQKRRVYLLDPKTDKHWRLDNVDAFQDAPAWNEDGSILYYVQREGDDMVLLAADPSTGRAQVIDGSRRPAPNAVGYYGQSNWDDVLAFRPDVAPAQVPQLAQTYADSNGGYSIQYPAGWQVGKGWSHLIYGCTECATISPSKETGAPDYGPLSGKLFLSIESTVQNETDTDKLLTGLLASPGPAQILNRGALLKAFDRRAATVDGKPALRLETMGEFGEVNHMLVIPNQGRVIILRGRGDGRVFDAMAASLHWR